MSTPFLVLGMHRSGTSLVSSLLYALGVVMGSHEDLTRRDETQPHGYYEDREWSHLNRRLIRACGKGRSWANPPSPQSIAEESGPFVEEIHELIDARGDRNKWGFKDPRTTLTFLALHPHLPRSTRYVIVRRNHEAIVRSLMKRNEVYTADHWRRLTDWYEYHLLQWERCYLHPSQVLTVWYEDLVGDRNRYEVTQALRAFVGAGDGEWRKALQRIETRRLCRDDRLES